MAGHCSAKCHGGNFPAIVGIWALFALPLYAAGAVALHQTLKIEHRVPGFDDPATHKLHGRRAEIFSNRWGIRLLNLVHTSFFTGLFACGMYEPYWKEARAEEDVAYQAICFYIAIFLGITHSVVSTIQPRSRVCNLVRWLAFSGHTALLLFVFWDFVEKSSAKSVSYTTPLAAWSAFAWLVRVAFPEIDQIL